MSKIEMSETLSLIEEDTFNSLHMKRIKKQFKRKKNAYYLKRGLLVASCGLIIFTGTLNLNGSFAETLSKVPMMGGLVKVLTFNRLTSHDSYRDIDIEIPNLEGLQDEALQIEINALLQSRAMTIYDKTMEEGNATEASGFISFIPANVNQGYQLLIQNETYFAFQVTTFTVGASGYMTSHVYNIDLEEQKLMVLSDVVSDFDDLNQQIIEEMNRRNDAGESFFIEDFIGVSDETNFYVKGDQLMIIFNEYEVAAGYMGMPEIVIDLK